MRRIRRHAFPIQLIALLAMVLGPAAAAIGFPCATHRGAAGAASACCYGSSQLPLSGPCCSVLEPTAGRALKWALPDGPAVRSPSVSAPSLERSAGLPAADRLLPGPQCDSRPDAGRAPPIA